MGASNVQEEPYTFTAWTPNTTSLTVTTGPSPGPVPLASFIPASGSTGPAGVDGDVVYLSALSTVNFVGVVTRILQGQGSGNPIADLLSNITTFLDNTAAGLSLLQIVADAHVQGHVVMYDVPRVPLTAGVFFPLSSYINDGGGTLGPTTPYSRPFVDMVLVPIIDAALQRAGAIGAIGVIDYPPAEADGSYYPFILPFKLPSVPGLYVDRDTGNQLKQELVQSGATPMTVHMTLDATKGDATSYNVSALIPGQCSSQIIVSSHTDGPNSIEDNGPEAIFKIAKYFLGAPPQQRRRTLRIVLTGGHFEGGVGMDAYIANHQADLSNALTAIEIEHLGAREWVELSPGVMGLSGLPELQVIEALPGTEQARISQTFLENFDRSLVFDLPIFGEGPPWQTHGNVPLIQFTTGPVYLLNGGLPQVTTDFTDYDLMQRQVKGFVQMILNLDADAADTLRSNAVDQ